MRPLERTVEELLLPAVDRLAADPVGRRRARVRRPLGDRLAARRPPPRLRRLAPGRDPPDRLEQGARRRGGPHPGARPRAAPRRLPRPRPLQRARRRAPRAGARRARPDRDRPLRPQRRDPRRGRPGPQDPRARLRRPALRLPRQRPDRRRRPLGRRLAEPGHRDAERGPPPPRLPGLRLVALSASRVRGRSQAAWSPSAPQKSRREARRPRAGGNCSRLAALRSTRLERGDRRFGGRHDDLRQRREVERGTVGLALGDGVVQELLEELPSAARCEARSRR